jgi:hypothetical protein
VGVGLAYLGPIKVDFHGDPSFSWGVTPKGQGGADVSISGSLDFEVGKQLKELVDNPHRAVTLGADSGPLDIVWFTDAKLRELRGFHLLTSCSLKPEQKDSLTGEVPFDLNAVAIGPRRRIRITRSAREKGNDYGLTAKSVLADPFGAGDFAVDPGGTLTTREFDPRHPYDVSAPPPPNAGSTMGVRVGSIVGSADELELVVLPSLELDSTAPPAWVVNRGGDCRAQDRRTGLEVYGPNHPFVRTSDVVLTNGLLALWAGPYGLPPYFHVLAFVAGQWREYGYLHLAEPNSDVRLLELRLHEVTPDHVTAVLTVDGGETFVGLRRGEWMVRGPREGVLRWEGLPPWSRLEAAVQGAGKFGNGLLGDGTGAPDLHLRWPPNL